ncbi:N-acetylmuramoyl-L-alanine amidase [Streptomyces sp. JJ38]|uniref:N-acetylmuramoyl-L-alanine amidase n=1 Tax=Streptomyces sp. JJ38 TaxID=2738128 RepID=UPI001C58B3F9|nr:N-acetylmuramoyl-L-alanine amidase [Streptomyces sp. JJ38]MBW1596543.1 N-acetylmuramoyl-L-alanine amidase [Streptomyces sp. JJ38]
MSPGRRALLVAAVLVPCCLLGLVAWLVARPAAGGAGSDAEPRERPGKAASEAAGTPSGPSASEPPTDGGPLAGTVVLIDPGHNPGNRNHPEAIGRQVDVGTHRKDCDAVGAETNAGYPEAEFTLDLARRVRDRLEAGGATVVLTHDGDRPHGPCIDERARIGNEAGADAAVSLHADGAAEGDRGFHVILPANVTAGAADTRGITGPSRRLGTHLVEHFAEATGTRPATYLGPDTAESGLDVRADLGGLNLSAVPKVFLECGNMRDTDDAALLTDDGWRARAADGIARGLTAFLTDRDAEAP